MGRRFLTEKPLLVCQSLRGAELASPLRRILAFGIDFVLTLIPGLAVAVGAAALTLYLEDPEALRGLRALAFGNSMSQSTCQQAVREALPLLVRKEMPGLPLATREAVERGDLEAGVASLEGFEYEFNLALGESRGGPLGPRTVRIEVDQLIPEGFRVLALYGVLGLYVTLLTSFWGRTAGKWLTGIRVARLDGHRLTLLESLERFAGYLHIPASLGLPLLDLWRDPNRRLPHDRIVHTAVIRSRKIRR